jgi:hypothetical protein
VTAPGLLGLDNNRQEATVSASNIVNGRKIVGQRKWLALIAMAAAAVASASDTAYKYQDESGATVYSDQPGADGAEKVRIESAPSADARAEAEQRVRRMEETSQELESARKAQQARRAEQEAERREPSPISAEPADDPVTVTGGIRRDPKRRIPVESPSGGEHPIYQPRPGFNRPPSNPALPPRPTPLPAPARPRAGGN